MRLIELQPCDAVCLDTATGDMFLPLLADLLDADLDVHVIIERRPPSYVLLVLGLSGDMIAVEHELPVSFAEIDERHRLVVLRLYVEGLVAGHERWRRGMNARLPRLGVGPIESSRSIT